MDISDRIQYLVGKSLRQTIDAGELDELLNFMRDDRYSIVIKELEKGFVDEFSSLVVKTDIDKWKERANSILKSDISDSEKEVERKPFYRMPFFKYGAAAAVMICLGSLIFWQVSHRQKQNITVSVIKTIVTEGKDIAPGRKRAVLKLANGTIISLDSMQKGNIASQGTTKIFKQDDGKIVYESAKNSSAEVLFNEMSTPNGGQYQLLLPDGTKVWMNAASFIRYPVNFSGKERKVEVKGEIYFEVAKNPDQPFFVDAGNGLEIRVLGTHFNINTYSDEKLARTTLLEGAVKISTGNSAANLRPGQQAQADASGAIQIKNNVDVDAAVAWKNGLFNFNKLDIRHVMNQLARWYDIEIRYEGKLSGQIYGGEIQMNLNLSQVLKIIGNSGVHCRLENRTLIVMP